MRALRLALAALALALASSCIEVVRWEAQDVHLRLDPEHDSAALLLVYERVFAGKPDEESLERAAAAIDSMAARKRYFAIGDWPLEFDLDECVRGRDSNPLQYLARDEPGPGSPEALAIEFFSGVRVREASLHLAGGELTVVQELELPRFSSLVRSANAALSRMVLAREKPEPGFAAEEWRAWREHAGSGAPWITADAQGLAFRAPYGARWMAELVKQIASGEGEPVLPGVADALSEIAVENGFAVFRWRPDEARIVRFRFDPPHGEPRTADGALAERVAASGSKLEREERADARVARFRR